MSSAETDTSTALANAEIFILAYKALSEEAKGRVLRALMEDKEFVEDMEAALIWERRKDEPTRPFREYLAEREEREG